jgi:hypothetical protein
MPMNASDTALAIAHTSSGAEALAKKYEGDEGPELAYRIERFGK